MSNKNTIFQPSWFWVIMYSSFSILLIVLCLISISDAGALVILPLLTSAFMLWKSAYYARILLKKKKEKEDFAKSLEDPRTLAYFNMLMDAIESPDNSQHTTDNEGRHDA